MRSVLFTKPKSIASAMLRHMVESGDEVAAVVLHGVSGYADTPLVKYARAHAVPVVDFADCDGFFGRLSVGALDAIWCCTFPKLVRDGWVNRAKVAVNFHGAPLPDYRGVFAYNFAILNGDAEFGVTAHLMSGSFDTGDIVETDRFPYDCANGSVAELVALSEERMLTLFKRVRGRLERDGRLEVAPQDLSLGCYYSRDDFEAAKRIPANASAEEVERRIRAFWYPPYEGAYVEVGGERFYPITRRILNGIGR
ncbi:Methionyl-tRNA formyltransferase [Coriobacteriaceae bacterium CHKCI002]|nr:Methionyl-tRNA formyltransferase [Coriobacteriaceae bacterium CHKCI002]